MNRKLVPMGALVVLMTASGALVATAQGLAGQGEAQRAELIEAHFKGDRDGRRGGRDAGFGMRGIAGLFAEVDQDGDGSITQADIDAYLEAQRTGADADGDGAVSLAEFEAIWLEQTRQAMTRTFQGLDADASGEITEAELSERFGGVVARMNRDGDGALTLQDRARGGRDRN